MLVRVLGDLEVVVGGRAADLGGPKPRAVVGLLVAAEGRPVPVERLVDEVWGSAPPARVESSLQSYVARLRRVLDPGRDGGRQRLRTHPGAYSLAVDDLDATRLVGLVGAATDLAAADPARAEALLDEAAGLWRGEPYGGLGWVPSLAAEATRLDAMHRVAQEERWRLRLDRGDAAGVAAELERAVRLDPLRERLWALLALACYRAARQGDALATLRRARQVLADELGVDPGEELRRLEDAVLRQDPALDARPPAPVALAGRGRGEAAATDAPEASPPTTSAPARPAAPGQPGVPGAADAPADPGDALVGRDEHLAAVAVALDAVTRGRGRVVLVRGEAGIGKSRFAGAVVAAAAARGFRTGRGTWDADGSPPLWGWSRAVEELLGEDVLVGATGEVLDAASQSHRLAGVLLDRLGDGGPALVVLDDVHWADDDSLRLLRRLVAQVDTVPLLLLVALRDTGHATHAITDLLASLARADPLRVELRGWDAAAVTAHVERRSGVRLDPAAVDAIVARTGGNPFYVTELVRLLAAEGALADPGGRGWDQVPSGVRDVVRARLAQLDDPVPEMLTAAAVVGRSFDLGVVARVTGRSRPEVDEVAEQGLGLGLLVEDGPDAFRFAHALVGDALRETLPAPSRSRLHAAVAVALEEHHAGRVGEHAGELAEHYRLAGPAHARSAWAFARRAAAQAAAGSAHAEALRWSRTAAQLQQQPGLCTPQEREAVLVGLARALRLLARPVEAWEPCEAAARSALDDGRPADAADALLEVTEDAIWGWRYRPSTDPAAIALWHEVLDARTSDGGDPLTPTARSLCEAGLAVEHVSSLGPTRDTTDLVDRALARARGSAVTARDLVAVLQLACVGLARHGLIHRRAVVADELVALTTREGDGGGLALALAKRGAVRGELGQWQAAHSDLLRASQLARRHHHTPVALIAGWGLAVVLQAQDDLAAARAEVDRLERLEDSLGMPGIGIAMAHRSALLMLEGRLGEIEPQLRRAAEQHPSTMRDLHAWALVTSGRHEEARLLLGAWADQPPIVPDYLWLTMAVLRAQLWLELGDADAVADLRLDLEPSADLVAAGGMSSLFSGSVAHTLGRLALHQGDLPAARRYLEQARATHDRMALPGWVARTDAVLADLVAAGG